MVSDNISLKFFDPKLRTKVIWYLSQFGNGATLEQKHEHDCHSVAFILRPCTFAEQNYCCLERQILVTEPVHNSMNTCMAKSLP